MTQRRQTGAEQAALRRIATLVAEGVQPGQLFAAVAAEVRAFLDADVSAILRFEGDGTATVMGTDRARRTAGERIELDPNYVIAAVRDTGQSARFDTDDPTATDMPEPVSSTNFSGSFEPFTRTSRMGRLSVASNEIDVRSFPAGR